MTADLRLAIPAACGWGAAILAVGMPGVALPALVVLWLVAGACVAASFVRRPFALVALAATAAALCCTSVALHAPARQPALLVEAADSGRQVVGTLVTTQTVLGGTFEAEMVSAAVGDSAVSAPIPVLVFGDAPTERIGIGARLEVTGRLAVAEDGDDRAFLLFPDSLELVAAPPGFLDWANGLRATFLAATQRLPGDGGDLLAGLAIGDTSAVSDELDAAMKASSLSHLTAVSGANCAIVIGLVLAAGRGLPRALRIGLSGLVLLAFVVLVTPEPSVLRAALMAALVLAALLGGRPARGVPILSLATIVLLVLDPWLSRNYGFALSVLATAGLLLLAGPLARALGRWLPNWLAAVIAVPVAAQLACQPVIILLDASLPTYGVLANLLAAPAAPLATVVGLAACVATAVVPPLGAVLAALAWVPATWIAAVAGFFAAAPAARLPWPGGAFGAVALALVTALAVAAVLGRRRWALVAVALLVVVYAGLVAGDRIAQLVGRPANWQFAGCDVGQGDAFLIRSAGQVALIDTGPEPAPLKACLDDLGVGRIDLLVLTHFDLDHVGGVQAVTGRVDRVIVGPSGGPDNDRLTAALGAQQVARGPGGLLGELRWSVLWPPQRLAGIEPGNEASVTVAFEPVGACVNGCLSGLFLGDLGESAQDRVLRANPVGTFDVVKVSHHGSSDQSEALYQRVQATVGMIGVGADNGYGHPTERLLDILARVGTVPVRTDEDGLILLSPGAEPGTVSVWTQR